MDGSAPPFHLHTAHPSFKCSHHQRCLFPHCPRLPPHSPPCSPYTLRAPAPPALPALTNTLPDQRRVTCVQPAPTAPAARRPATRARQARIRAPEGRLTATCVLLAPTAAAGELRARRVPPATISPMAARHRASRALLAPTAAAGKCRALCVRPAVTKAEAGNRVAAPALPALTAVVARHHVPTHGHRLLHPLPPARPMAVCCNVPWVNAVIVALWLRNELPCHLPIFPPFYT